MPSKYQEYRQMADTAERQLTSSYKSWTQFLRTAARLYKYPYNEQVMIHAQRPDATACAEYDFWNKKMGRFIRRGSTGIALIDTSGQKPQLRFDILEEVQRRLPGFPIVLHGASSVNQDHIKMINQYGGQMPDAIGIPEDMLREAASMAVCKINIDSDIRLAMTAGIRRVLFEKPSAFDPREYLKVGREEVRKMVKHKIVNVLGSNGKA